VLAWPTATAPRAGTLDRDIIENARVRRRADIDLAALRQQAAERIKARADAQPQSGRRSRRNCRNCRRSRFDIVFDPDSSLIRPAS
jgi:hypothetical protein